MRSKKLYIFLIMLAAIVAVTAVFYDKLWLQKFSQLFVLFPFLGYYRDQIRTSTKKFYGFFISLIAASATWVVCDKWYFAQITVALSLVCFAFLFNEAIHYTRYRKGSRIMQVYFVVVVSIYTYFLALHLIEIKGSLKSSFMFSTYLLYYFNLFVLGIAALVYYLNSFSRKSIYFISFVLSLILSHVLRDMGALYFRDLSVEILGNLIRFAGYNLLFLFFTTKEKRLSLLNLSR